jgi:hypothetical protein
MAALFPPWTNSVFRATAVAVVATPVGGVSLLMVQARTPFATGQREPVQQPVQFDHRHHVSDDGIDCRYCHQTVEQSAYAGMPSTATCMGCHAQIWSKSPLLDEVRKAYFADRGIPWQRVNRLPDFAYFNHAIHVHKGIGCETCHGRMDRMATGEQASPLTMGWCLECHRHPEASLRPQTEITALGWHRPPDTAMQPAALAAAYGLHTRTSCSTCHR